MSSRFGRVGLSNEQQQHRWVLKEIKKVLREESPWKDREFYLSETITYGDVFKDIRGWLKALDREIDEYQLWKHTESSGEGIISFREEFQKNFPRSKMYTEDELDHMAATLADEYFAEKDRFDVIPQHREDY